MTDQPGGGKPTKPELPELRIPKLLPGRDHPPTTLETLGLFCALVEILFTALLIWYVGSAREMILLAILGLPFLLFGGLYLLTFFRPMNVRSPGDFVNPPTVGEFAAALVTTRTAVGPLQSTGQVIEATAVLAAASTMDGERKSTEDEIVPLPADDSREPSHWAEVLLADVGPAEIDFAKADEAFQRKQQGLADLNEQLADELRYRYFRFTKGDSSALRKIEELAETVKPMPKLAAQGQIHVGLAYLVAGGARKAESALRLAQELAIEPMDKAAATGLCSVALRRRDRKEEAHAMIVQAINESTDDEALHWLYTQLASFMKTDGDDLGRALALEKALEHSPASTSDRVDAGLVYSDIGLHAVAMFHNMKVLDSAPAESWAANNLGVELQQLGLHALAIDNYRASFNMRNSLAGANLAYRFVSAGFVDEALEAANKGLAFEDPHANAAEAIATASRQRQNESERRDALQINAAQQTNFLSRLADKRFTHGRNVEDFEGVWVFETGPVAMFVETAESLEGAWSEGRRKYKLKATKIEHGAEIDRINWESEPLSFNSGESADGGYLFLTANQNAIEIMALDGQDATFYKLRRLPTPPTEPAKAIGATK